MLFLNTIQKSVFPDHCTVVISGLLTAMFGTAGTLIKASKQAQNQGKVRREIHAANKQNITEDIVRLQAR
jgi:hypothetical protein